MNQKQLQLDKEEQILQDFGRGKFESLKSFRAEKQRLEATASKMLQKGKRINIRISARDLEQVKKRAAAEGMPYQTLIASALHKFVTGQLKEAQ